MNDNMEPTIYSVDDETKGLLTELLNLVEGLADLQMTDESTEEMRLLNRMVGERFGIEFSEIVLESDKDSEGNPRFTVKAYREKDLLPREAGSHLRLVSDNDKKGAPDGVSNDPNNEQG